VTSVELKTQMAFAATQSQVLTGQRLAVQHTCRPRSARALLVRTRAAFQLADLPFPIDSLEKKGMSKETFEFHWGKHHRAYVDNLNKQIEGKDLASKSLEEVVKATWNGGKPSAEFNNAAQIWNHDFFWNSMSPNGGGEPQGELREAIDRDFGSYEEFKKQFSTAGATQFGSGWAWLVLDNGKLKVTKTPNAETPLASGAGTPLLTMDVWEHAYYIDVQNRRPAYMSNYIDNLINWDKVAERYAAAK
jgi:Fe-Mn family superoxide dismutase